MTRPRNTATTTAVTALVAAVAFALLLPGRPAAALGAPDAAPPEGAVGGVRSPASGMLELRLSAYDGGSGLAAAEAILDGGPTSYLRLGSGTCPEHPIPGSEPPPGAECPESVSGVPLSLDTRSVPYGERRLRVSVTDGAGNTATLVDEEIVVRNAPRAGAGPIATVTVGISGQGSGEQPDEGHGLPPSPPGAHGRCRAPKLAMHLARKPLWRTRPRHVPVLHYRHRYPFRGRLTCLVSGRRRFAPRGTAVGIYLRVWRRSFDRHRGRVKFVRRATIKVRKGGRLRARLAFRSGRTVLFRYRAQGGETAKAKLRVAIPPRTRRPPWGPR